MKGEVVEVVVEGSVMAGAMEVMTALDAEDEVVEEGVEGSLVAGVMEVMEKTTVLDAPDAPAAERPPLGLLPVESASVCWLSFKGER